MTANPTIGIMHAGLAIAELPTDLVLLRATLREYFDPNSGRLSEQIERLVKKGGEFEQVIGRQIGVELANTLASYVGENRLLMRALVPGDSVARRGTTTLHSNCGDNQPQATTD